MAFQDSALSLKERLNLGDAKPPVIIGVVVVIALIVACLLVGTGYARTGGTELTKANFSSQGMSGIRADAGGAASPQKQPARALCVYISGCVVSPDVYYISEGARVADVVSAAGGFSADAATSTINLARVISDGEHIVIPSVSEATAPASATVASTGAPTSGAAGVPAAGGRVNINTADAAALQTLSGVGASTAAKIVADREKNGPFKSIDDLKRVSGIGDKKFESLKDFICVN